jgi:hypothetical protein
MRHSSVRDGSSSSKLRAISATIKYLLPCNATFWCGGFALTVSGILWEHIVYGLVVVFALG